MVKYPPNEGEEGIAMREELMSVMREFYHDGIPDGVVSRDECAEARP